MHVLVIGGTHFIGRAIVKHFRASGHTITVFHRGYSEPDDQANVRHIHGDRKKLREFRSQFKRLGFDAMIDTFAMGSGDAEPVRESLGGLVERAVVISSADVYHAWNGVLNNQPVSPLPIRESDPLRSNHFIYEKYAIGRKKYEKCLVEGDYLEMNRKGDIPCCIARLPVVYGPHDPQTRTAPYDEMAFRKRRSILMGSGASWIIHRVFVMNVAESILKIIENGTPGEIYNVGDSRVQSNLQWILQIGRHFNVEWEINHVPDNELPDHLNDLRFKAQHMILDISKLEQTCGYRELIPPEQGLEITLNFRQRQLRLRTESN